MTEFNLELNPDINCILEESSANSFVALRSLRWNENSNFKLDIRKWFIKSNGEEVAGKGVSFSTEDGPNNLITSLIDNGYGKSYDIINSLRDRDDFAVSIKKAIEVNNIDLDSINLDDDKDTDEVYYDPKSILGV